MGTRGTLEFVWKGKRYIYFIRFDAGTICYDLYKSLIKHLREDETLSLLKSVFDKVYLTEDLISLLSFLKDEKDMPKYTFIYDKVVEELKSQYPRKSDNELSDMITKETIIKVLSYELLTVTPYLGDTYSSGDSVNDIIESIKKSEYIFQSYPKDTSRDCLECNYIVDLDEMKIKSDSIYDVPYYDSDGKFIGYERSGEYKTFELTVSGVEELESY